MLIYEPILAQPTHQSEYVTLTATSTQTVATWREECLSLTCRNIWLLPGALYRLVARNTHPHTSTPRDGSVCSKDGDARKRMPPGYRTRYHCSTACRERGAQTQVNDCVSFHDLASRPHGKRCFYICDLWDMK